MALQKFDYLLFKVLDVPTKVGLLLVHSSNFGQMPFLLPLIVVKPSPNAWVDLWKIHRLSKNRKHQACILTLSISALVSIVIAFSTTIISGCTMAIWIFISPPSAAVAGAGCAGACLPPPVCISSTPQPSNCQRIIKSRSSQNLKWSRWKTDLSAGSQ